MLIEDARVCSCSHRPLLPALYLPAPLKVAHEAGLCHNEDHSPRARVLHHVQAHVEGALEQQELPLARLRVVGGCMQGRSDHIMEVQAGHGVFTAVAAVLSQHCKALLLTCTTCLPPASVCSVCELATLLNTRGHCS